ncbi:MAG: SET domain-containing protein [Thermoprotei archaeon]
MVKGERIPSAFYAKVKVSSSPLGGMGLFAMRHIPEGTPILRLGGFLVGRRPRGDRYALRVGRRLFLVDSKDETDYVNHSCDPNCRIDFSTLNLVSTRSISAGEELTINYCTSEYDIQPEFRFACSCGAKGCYGTVAGFAHLPPDKRKRILPWCSQYIASKAQ